MAVACLLILWGGAEPAMAQGKPMIYKYDADNYLPSNHVYMATRDKQGYLWLATTQGVLKYNGYSFRKFGKADGIPNEDVWKLVVDDKNRIWLGSISSCVGYIYNDKFYKILNSNTDKEYYPRNMQSIKGGIAFMLYSMKDSASYRLGLYITLVYYRDTLTTETYYAPEDQPRLNGFDNEGSHYELLNDTIYKREMSKGKLVKQYLCRLPPSVYSFADSLQRDRAFASNYIIGYHNLRGGIYFLNVKNCVFKTYNHDFEKGEKIIHFNFDNKYLSLYTGKRVTIFSDSANVIEQFRISRLVHPADTTDAVIVYLHRDDIWNAIVTTNNKGYYQHYGTNNFNVYDKADMKDAVYAGASAMGTQYWWNNNTEKLYAIRKDGSCIVHDLPKDWYMYSIKAYDKEKSLIGTRGGAFFLYEQSLRIQNIVDGITYSYDPAWELKKMSQQRLLMYTITSTNVKTYLYNKDTIYYRVIQSLAKMVRFGDSALFTTIRQYSTNTDVADTISHQLYFAEENKLHAYNLSKNIERSVSAAALRQMGIDSIGKILLTPRGDFIIITTDKVLFFDIYKRRLQRLPNNMRLDNMVAELYNNNLVLASKWGLCFYKIYHDGSIAGPVYMPNYKYASYKFINEGKIHVSDTEVWMNTDKAMYRIAIPHDTLFAAPAYFPHSLFARIDGRQHSLAWGDTVRVQQASPVLQMDVVNPAGVGQPVYYYYIKGVQDRWQQLTNNEWFVTGLKPGVYYDVLLRTGDDGWLSKPVYVKLYMMPKWWQTNTGKWLLFAGGVGLLLMMVWAVMLITRNIVNRKNARKNLETELNSLRTSLELKSIHAQINPHFIFNTLSTGLYYIKKRQMDEAYEHIASFSELLRAYIKSSRDKYIMLDEEIDNLKKYVLLQQSRFENLFEFDVEVADGINIYNTKIPALLLQPLVENAISHGLFHKESAGRLLLRFDKNAYGALICTIDDDGIGRQKSKDINNNTTYKTQSYGTDLVKELIETFNKYEPVDIQIEYIDKQLPDTGTIVVLTINYTLND